MQQQIVYELSPSLQHNVSWADEQNRRLPIIAFLMIPIGKKGRINKTKSTSCFDSLKKSPPSKHSTHLEALSNRQNKVGLVNIMDLNDRQLPQSIDRKDWHEALRILHRAEAALSEQYAQQIRKDKYLYQAIIFNNKAFVLNELQNDEEAVAIMQKCLLNLQTAQKMAASREEQVAYKTLTIKMGLKYCALLSHSQNHQEAIAYAQETLQTINSCLQILVDLCSCGSYDFIETPETQVTSQDSRQRQERVDFKRIVVKEAQKLLKKIEEFPSPQQLLGNLKGYFQQKMKNMYFWKDNEANNVKGISKELFRNEAIKKGRNILGIQKSSSFIQQFSLSEVMSLDLIRLSFRVNVDLYYLLSSPKVVELVLLGSVSYFLIATEKRFKQGNLDMSKMKIADRYNCLSSDTPLAESKVLHLKAIQLAGHHLPEDNDYFLHLINSFNKNYKSVLDQIKQESEVARKSRGRSSSKKNNDIQTAIVSTTARKSRRKKTERIQFQRPTHNLAEKKSSPRKRQRCKSGLKRTKTESHGL